MDSGTAATITRVSKRYGSTTALDGVSLAVRGGELTALLGPNGAGKTTAVRLLLGLAAPDDGEVRVFGLDPRRPANRVRTGFMLQVGKVAETLRVREHVELFSSYYPAPLPLAESLAAAGLSSLANRRFGELSGGERQRVLFALAICGNPGLLVLDEPTVGLDVEARRAVWEQIRLFLRRGKAVLLTTHYLAEAEALADRVAVLDSGRVIAEGTSAEIKARAGGRRVRCMTRVTADVLRRLPGVAAVALRGDEVELTTMVPEDVVRRLFELDPSLSGLEITSGALEDAFVQLVGASKEVA